MKMGVIGIGRWGSKILPKYRMLVSQNELEKVVTCDIKERDADFKRYEDMLPLVDGVHICLPNNQHFEVVKDCLESGKHVLVEKPITEKSDEAYQLVEIATEAGKILQVGHVMRFDNTIRKAKEMFDSKEMGTVYEVNIHWTDYRPDHEGENIMWDLLPHPLDAMHFIFGRYPKKWSIYRGVNLVDIMFSYKIPVFTKLSWNTRKKQRLIEFDTDKGLIRAECTDMTINGKQVEKGDAITEEIRNFIKSIEDGHSRFNSHIIGARNTEIIERIVETPPGDLA